MFQSVVLKTCFKRHKIEAMTLGSLQAIKQTRGHRKLNISLMALLLLFLWSITPQHSLCCMPGEVNQKYKTQVLSSGVSSENLHFIAFSLVIADF